MMMMCHREVDIKFLVWLNGKLIDVVVVIISSSFRSVLLVHQPDCVQTDLFVLIYLLERSLVLVKR